MKTIKEWLDMFPEPQRSKALANINQPNGVAIAVDAFDAIIGAFDWSSSPEGPEYWAIFAQTLDDGTI
jgi:hypothetical protein